MQSKISSLEQAVALVESGARIALGGNTFHRGPGAAVHELVRQHKSGLDLIKTAGSYDIDLLCATGVASSVSAGYVGYETVLGMAPSYRRTVQGGQVTAHEHACYTVIAGLRAAIQGVPFMPVAGLLGSDLLAARDFRTVADPYTVQEVVAVQAIVPDVAIIHVHESDEYGNALIKGSIFEDLLMIQAARKVILTAERIVDGRQFERADSHANISALYVDAVVLQPAGAWPFGLADEYEPDLAVMQEFVDLVDSPERLTEFVRDRILSVAVA